MRSSRRRPLARDAAEAERACTEAERTHAADQHLAVVEGLGTNLARLASGDLTCSLDQSLASGYDS